MASYKRVIHPSAFEDGFSSVITPDYSLSGKRYEMQNGQMAYRRDYSDGGYQGPNLSAYQALYPYQSAMLGSQPRSDIPQGMGLKSMFKKSKKKYKQIKDALFSLDDYSAEEIYHKLKQHDDELVQKAKEVGVSALSKALAETLGDGSDHVLNGYIKSAVDRLVDEAKPKGKAMEQFPMEGASLKSMFKGAYDKYKDLKKGLSKLTGISSVHDIYLVLYDHKDEIISRAMDVGVPALSGVLATAMSQPELTPLVSLALRALLREVTGHALSGGSLKGLVVKDVIDHFVKIDAHSPEKHEVKKGNVQYVKEFLLRHKRDIAKVVVVMGVPILLKGIKAYFNLDEDEMALIKGVLEGASKLVGGEVKKEEPVGKAVHVEAEVELEGVIDDDNIKLCEVSSKEGSSDKRSALSRASARNNLVKKVMRDQKLTMPEASHYVKVNNMKY